MDWMATLGVGAFLFFLIKGLLWLAAPIAFGMWAKSRRARAQAEQADDTSTAAS